jgi:hypothetical protein
VGTELRQQYDLLAEGAQERTGSDTINDVIGDLQSIKEYTMILIKKAVVKKNSGILLKKNMLRKKFLRRYHYVS